MWASLVALLSKVMSWLPTLIAYLAGRRSVSQEIELDNAKKQTEYAEIEGRERTDDDLIKSIKDGTF